MADPTNIDMETFVNGECRQRFNTRDMVFNICRAISRSIRVTSSAVGRRLGTAADSSELLPDKTSAPERFLKPGDVVEMRSPSIGSLRNAWAVQPVSMIDAAGEIPPPLNAVATIDRIGSA
jgi:2-keto-4-pentenoate hydratase/2-oxohepta-3-ene-1,7-dioic acid hydratase in catechol pathway